VTDHSSVAPSIGRVVVERVESNAEDDGALDLVHDKPRLVGHEES